MMLKIVYGILKVICPISTVQKPKGSSRSKWERKFPMTRKTSIREIPVTISAFSMGMLAMPMKRERQRFFILFMAMQGAEADEGGHESGESGDDHRISKGCQKDLFILKSSVYQRVVKPPQRARLWTG